MNNAGGENFLTLISMVSIMFLVLYLLVIRPRNKREKEVAKMRSNLKIGDIITTIGGIVGIVISVKDEYLTLETGNDRNKIRIKKWAVQSIEQIENKSENKTENKTAVNSKNKA